MFGPQPRSYDYQLPKKVEKGALRAALAAEDCRAARVIVVDALTRRRDEDQGGGRRC